MNESDKDKIRLITILMALVAGVFFVTIGQAAGTYYVAQNGSDNNSCATAQNIDTPKRNIMGNDGGIACMRSPGDTLLIRQGSYPEIISNYWHRIHCRQEPAGTTPLLWPRIPAKLSWSSELRSPPRITLTSISHTGFSMASTLSTTSPVASEAIWMGSPDHLRFANMEVTNGHEAHKYLYRETKIS